MWPESHYIIMPDPTPLIRFSSVLPKKARIILYKNQPGSELVLDHLVRFGPKGSGPEQAAVQESSDTVFARVFEPVRDPDQACLLGSDDSMKL